MTGCRRKELRISKACISIQKHFRIQNVVHIKRKHESAEHGLLTELPLHRCRHQGIGVYLQVILLNSPCSLPAAIVYVLHSCQTCIRAKRKACIFTGHPQIAAACGEAGNWIVRPVNRRNRKIRQCYVLRKRYNAIPAEGRIRECVQSRQDPGRRLQLNSNMPGAVRIPGTRNAKLIQSAAGHDLISELHPVRRHPESEILPLKLSSKFNVHQSLRLHNGLIIVEIPVRTALKLRLEPRTRFLAVVQRFHSRLTIRQRNAQIGTERLLRVQRHPYTRVYEQIGDTKRISKKLFLKKPVLPPGQLQVRLNGQTLMGPHQMTCVDGADGLLPPHTVHPVIIPGSNHLRRNPLGFFNTPPAEGPVQTQLSANGGFGARTNHLIARHPPCLPLIQSRTKQHRRIRCADEQGILSLRLIQSPPARRKPQVIRTAKRPSKIKFPNPLDPEEDLFKSSVWVWSERM